MPNENDTGVGKITPWVGVASSILAIGLTIFNTQTQSRLASEELSFKTRSAEFESEVKKRSQNLEESKEKTERYRFVHSMSAGLADKDKNKKEVTINLIRLALSDDEESSFFSGLAQSTDSELQNAGKTGVQISKEVKRSSLQSALEKEREGFQHLIDGNYGGAMAAFDGAETAYPTHNNVYELGRILRANRGHLDDAAMKKEMFQTIVKKYAFGAPPDLWSQVKAIAEN